ncbi:imidazole glycerol phosphate synthase cyclase subunit [Patescibacteria group bacterium]|nr:imidazole glycerol phosphate synthase cyclase subunit [Patescibacteria group bacterium]
MQSVHFRHTNAVGNALTAVDFFHTWTVDEIIVLDVSRIEADRSNFYQMIRELSRRCFIPLTVGGKIKTVEDMRELFRNGADKIAINTEAVRNPNLITEGAHMYGGQAIVVSIDAKKTEEQTHEVCIQNGSAATGLLAPEWAKTAEERGAGEIFLTSIDCDGSLQGYDIALVRSVSEAVHIPVIASGGVGEWQHFVDGIMQGKADAVSAANIFHFSEQSTRKAKDYMLSHGIDVRKPAYYTVQTPRYPEYKV